MVQRYDAGLLNDFGGGNVGWWQDYIRYELNRCSEYYEKQIYALERENEELRDNIKYSKIL